MTDAVDEDFDDLDVLSRADLAELSGPAYTVACILDDWNRRLHGIISSDHGAGLFLDLLAAEGWRVTPIVAPMLVVEFPAGAADAQVERFEQAWPNGAAARSSTSGQAMAMAELLTEDDAVRLECRNHTLTVTAHLDFRGLASSEPVLFDIDCSCGGLHMGGTVAEMMTLTQAHLRGHGIPVSQYWPRLHPDHPRAVARA